MEATSNKSNKQEKRDVCEQKPEIVKSLLKNVPKTVYWKIGKDCIIKLREKSHEFKLTSKRFNTIGVTLSHHGSLDKIFNITQIERIENPELMAAYLLKRAQLEVKEPKLKVRNTMMFHATTRANCEQISREGFDWRKFGNQDRTIWGRGTSLTPLPHITIYFGTPDDDGVYSILMCKVLQRNTLHGIQQLPIPPDEFESVCNDDGTIVVVFDDFFVYPEYIITVKILPYGLAFFNHERTLMKEHMLRIKLLESSMLNNNITE